MRYLSKKTVSTMNRMAQTLWNRPRNSKMRRACFQLELPMKSKRDSSPETLCLTTCLDKTILKTGCELLT